MQNRRILKHLFWIDVIIKQRNQWILLGFHNWADKIIYIKLYIDTWPANEIRPDRQPQSLRKTLHTIKQWDDQISIWNMGQITFR